MEPLSLKQEEAKKETAAAEEVIRKAREKRALQQAERSEGGRWRKGCENVEKLVPVQPVPRV